ncbi:glycosyltransferase [Dehalococcoidia bacterium]|nr:glycosyltransferase [Dehalococcoidia bacterium]
MKVSLISTLKNEGSSIKEFVDSLLSQSRPPDEIVIVDGGSTDKTTEIINSYINKGAPIKLIIKKGTNIAKGANIAIKSAKHDLIASTHAGCRLDKDWLKNLMKPLVEDPSIDVVSGWYEPDVQTDFEDCVAQLTCPKLERVLSNADKFLPSSRSVAYKKEVWEKVGGYPEWLSWAAEDTLFALSLRKAGYKFTFMKDAVVYWRMRPNLRGFFKQYYLYARGGGEAGAAFQRYHITYLLYLLGLALLLCGWFFLPLLWFLLIACVVTYLLRPSIRVYKSIKKLKVFAITPILVLARDFATIYGSLVGTVRRIMKINRPIS